MSDFELIAISLSFILGLGVAQMLTAVMELIREHRTVQFDWVPLVWFFCILAWHFQIWFGTCLAPSTPYTTRVSRALRAPPYDVRSGIVKR